jgi:tetratricopeptide (TPR) repeat protein
VNLARLRLVFTAGFAVGLAGWIPAAAAQPADPRAAALEQLRAGAERIDRGDYVGALAHFQEAHRLFPSPKIDFDIGLACQGLGRNAQALAAFQRFLDQAGDATPKTRAKAERNVAALEPLVAVVTIAFDRPGARIAVDGEPFGTTPLPRGVPLDPGEHELSLDHEGRRQAQRVRVVAGERPALRFVVAAPVPARPPEAVAARVPVPPPAETGHPFYKAVWFWALTAAAVGGAAVAVAASRRTEYPHVDATFPAGK